MRVLLDECVPARLKRAFSGHEVQTVTEAGWKATKDDALLALAEKRFDVFVTIDRKLEEQVRLERYDLRTVIVRVPDSRLTTFDPLLPELLAAVKAVRRREVIHLVHPKLKRG